MDVLFDHGTVIPRRVKDRTARIVFRGGGTARFRLQHTHDRHGQPDPIGWCEVTALSNGRTDPEPLIRNGVLPGGVLVDQIDGEGEVLYRRHIADWIRVVPFDGQEYDATPNAGYQVTMERAA